jgi:hypothetical protein
LRAAADTLTVAVAVALAVTDRIALADRITVSERVSGRIGHTGRGESGEIARKGFPARRR